MVFIDAINVKIRDGQVASRPVKTALISGGPGKYLAVTSDGPAAPPVGGAGSDRSAAPLRSGVPTTARKPDCLPIHIADGLVRAPVRVMAAIWRGSVDPSGTVTTSSASPSHAASCFFPGRSLRTSRNPIRLSATW